MYVHPQDLRDSDRIYLDVDNKAHSIGAVYQMGDRWAVEVPDIQQTIQIAPDEDGKMPLVQIFREGA
jgi:hypothetical protein